MVADVGLSELLRICCGPLNRIPPPWLPSIPGLPEKRHRDRWCFLLPRFPLLSRYLGFRRRLIRWLTTSVESLVDELGPHR